MKILIVKRDKLGDLLLTTPLFAALRAALPNAQIHLLANDYNAWVADGHPALDKIWVYPRVKVAGSVRLGAVFRQLGQSLQLRREGFDVVIVGQGEESPRAIKRALWVRAPRTISYAARVSHYGPRLTDPLPPPSDGHETERMLALLQPLGIARPIQPIAPYFKLPAAAAEFTQRWLAEYGLEPGGYVVLGLGARRAKKQPSTGQIERWTRHFHDTWGLKTVFMWTPGKSDNPLYPGDDEVAEPVLQRQLPQLVPFRGPLREALGLIWSARTSLFPDSGLMHFAAASPGGVLGLFADREHSPSPLQWGPVGPRARWLEAETAVADLSDTAVYEAVAALLEGGRASGPEPVLQFAR